MHGDEVRIAAILVTTLGTGFLPALPPCASVFVWMHGDEVRIAAILVTTLGASAVRHPIGDDHAWNPNGVHALLQPIVLSPALPAQVLAGLLASFVSADSLLRHDFD